MSSAGTLRLDGEQLIVHLWHGSSEKVRAITTIRDQYGGKDAFAGQRPCWVLPLAALNDVIEEFPDLESVA